MNGVPMEVWQYLSGWLAANQFTVLDVRSDGGEKIIPHWDGQLLLRPKPGDIVAIREWTGGATIVFELAIRPSGDTTTVHVEGYSTGRGPGWKGREFEFTNTALAVAGVPRKRGTELLRNLESMLAMMSSTAPSPTAPLASGAGWTPHPDARGIPSGAAALSPGQGAVIPSSAPGTAPSVSPDDPVARKKAYRWSDHRVSTRPFPFTSAVQLPAVPASRLQSRLSEMVFSLGFEVVLESPPRFDGKPPTESRFDRHRGLVVGECDLRIDAELRRRSIGTAVTCGVVAIALMGLLFSGVVLAFGRMTVLLAAPAGLLLGVALWSAAGAGSFDSDIVWIQYTPIVATPASLTDSRLPVPFEVRIGAGSVSSRNWAGKGSGGRDIKGMRPPNPQLSNVPREIARQLSENSPP